MLEHAHRFTAWGLALALSTGLLTTAPALGQTTDELTDPPGAGTPFIVPAGLNADTVDGVHAVKATAKKAKRKNKLMAFGSTGYLPTNIVKGGIATLAALRSPVGAVNQPDNPVHWNQLNGVPATLVDGDDVGYVTVLSDPITFAGDEESWLYLDVPFELDISTIFVPVNVGGEVYVDVVSCQRLSDTTNRHYMYVINASDTESVTFRARTRVFDPGIATAKLKRIARNLDLHVANRRALR